MLKCWQKELTNGLHMFDRLEDRMSSVKISIQEIDLWITSLDEIDDFMLHEYQSHLRDEEKAYAQRFLFFKERKRYIVTRTLERYLLSKYLRIAPDSLKIEKGAFGKPYIPDNSTIALQYNLSHAENLIACAVSLKAPIGIDLEETVKTFDFLDIAKNTFRERAHSALLNLADHVLKDRFYSYWALNECFYKTHGGELKGKPAEMDFFINTDSKRILYFQGEPTCHWKFYLLSLAKKYRVAICLQTPKADTSFVINSCNLLPYMRFSLADSEILQESADWK